MRVDIKRATLAGNVRAIASKSHAHRLLICAALSREPSKVLCEETSEDIEATADCLRALGAGVLREQNGYAVFPMSCEDQHERVLKCRESGSTLRFLLPVACALGGKNVFYGEGRLMTRPLSPLYEQLMQHGCQLSAKGENPLYCQGKLQSGAYALPGNISSQFVSGLLFALPLLEGESRLQLTGKVESRPYIQMTLCALQQAGIVVQQDEAAFTVAGRQVYQAPATCQAEGDWSNAAFWLCAGAFSKKGMIVHHLKRESLQGDRAIVDILQQFGAKTEWAQDSCSVSAAPLRGIAIDARNIPDLVPVLAVVACGAVGRTVITHAERLRLKESDRLQVMYEILRTLGAKIELCEDGFVIDGTGMLNGGTVKACGDHRMAMAAAIAACICRGPVRISGAEAVRKSYPGFFTDMKNLGAELKWEEE